MSLYLIGIYGGDEEWLRERWKATGKKLDMGKSCVHFAGWTTLRSMSWARRC
jgi:hypothetical protein